MSVLTACQEAARRLIGQKPATFFGAPGKFEIEICGLLNEVAEVIARGQDWQNLTKIATINGDGTAEAFDLPADYDRMLLTSRVQDTDGWWWGYFRFTDIGDYLWNKSRGFTPYPGGWIIYDNQMNFSPAPSLGMVAQFPYVSRFKFNGKTKATADADTDTFDLPERLLTLGIIWKWREDKQLDSTGAQEAFMDEMNNYGSKDKGAQVIRSGRRRRWPGVGIAYPGVLG